ncbi:tRNA (adenosine(37)-N6)-threonylcarbamoyltransferase complex ATPase subunit type 1 TsaE [Chitinimonas sp. PSY-7]|uniref:tRNA (adenosine(37)-N6)-threonylcarbamoyltransferase complex ATPase subunit type 1 TsaE n=1 Tax=Chitinimonas sp. PSY-7 TaxID=3459088 RepID=UPI00403FE8F1
MHSQDHTLSVFLADEAATLGMGKSLAPVMRGGLTIYLQGDLGAGKTTLTRGILHALGHQGRVKSPTYTLVEPYVISNLYFHHFDLYRFGEPDEWEDAGFREMFNPDSICLVEWPDKAAGLLPPPDWIISLEPEADGRRFNLQAPTLTGKACLASLTDLPLSPNAA